MDGDKIKRDFEEFLSKHPENVIEKDGLRLFVSSELSMFCFEYDYPLDYARKKLKRLGVISKHTLDAWDPDIRGKRNFYVLDGGNLSIDENGIVEEAREILEHAPKVVWENHVWICKKHFLDICKKNKITYFRLLQILRKHRLVGRTRSTYDRESKEVYNVVEVLWDKWEKHTVEKVKRILEEIAFRGRFIARDDIVRLAKDMCMTYRDFVNLLRRNDLIKERIVAFRIGRV